jgi:hypothetical protein
VSPYLVVLEQLAAVQGASQRIAALYDVVLPRLGERYRAYLAQTDTLMDAPTVRVMERVLDTQARMQREAMALREQMPALRPDDATTATALIDADAAVGELAAAAGDERQAA